MSEAREDHVDAKQAAALLEVSVQTLYAYVSRGWIGSEAMPGTRKRRYARAELERFRATRVARGRRPARAAAGTLHYGAPVLDSAITRVSDDGRLLYREHDAVELSRSARFEQVAMLIWSGDLETCFPPARTPLVDARWQRALRVVLSGKPPRPVDAFATLLPLAGATDPARFDRRPEAVREVGAHMLRLMVRIAGAGSGDVEAPIAEALCSAWVDEPDEPASSLIEAGLVLCAEHELDVSAFAARCVASAGSTPYAVVSGGLAALSGPRHGGHVERVCALFVEAGDAAAAADALDGRLARGESVPGFEHRLYPDGDPRGAELLRRLEAVRPEDPDVRLARALSDAAASRFGGRPTIDVGLVALARTLGLSGAHAVALFAVARTVGWIGHAIEQYASPQLIRPRARYTGGVEGDRSEKADDDEQ